MLFEDAAQPEDMHAGVLLDAAPLSTNDLIEKLNTNILPKIRQQLNDLSKNSDNNDATEALKKQLQVRTDFEI